MPSSDEPECVTPLHPVYTISLTTTLFHWLSLSGRSRWLCTHLAYAGYMTVSDVGRTAMCSPSSEEPECVTHATSGAKSAMWVFSRSSADWNWGKGLL